MADVRAFRGLRYDLARVGALADVIAPPYDVIDEESSQRLHARHDYNVIRLILNPTTAEDTPENSRYTRAAKFVREWRRQGVLMEEGEAAIYVYHQTFAWEGRSYTRRGFMCRVRLEPFGTGQIFPHEETMPGPKADRLKLFHATGFNLSQIFGLFPDESNSVADMLDDAIRSGTPLQATDDLGVEHNIWTLTDPELITQLRSHLGPQPIFIADGHHRYETGCAYLEERRAAGAVSGPDDPANFILMSLVGMSDPGLQVMPTHRLVTGMPGLTSEQLDKQLAEHFSVQVVGAGAEAGTAVWEEIVSSGRQDALGFHTTADDAWHLATLKDGRSMDAIVADHSPTWKSLGVSILHRLVLEHCLAPLGKASCTYVHDVSGVLTAVSARSCDLACLVQPASIEHIRQLAATFEKMPPKSTYFYPKLASGLVFNSIA